MALLFGFLLIFAIVLAVLLGLTIGVGFLLHWLIPAVGMDMSLLTAAIIVGLTVLVFTRVANMPEMPDEQEDTGEQRPIVILDPEVAFPTRRRRRRRS